MRSKEIIAVLELAGWKPGYFKGTGTNRYYYVQPVAPKVVFDYRMCSWEKVPRYRLKQAWARYLEWEKE